MSGSHVFEVKLFIMDLYSSFVSSNFRSVPIFNQPMLEVGVGRKQSKWKSTLTSHSLLTLTRESALWRRADFKCMTAALCLHSFKIAGICRSRRSGWNRTRTRYRVHGAVNEERSCFLFLSPSFILSPFHI